MKIIDKALCAGKEDMIEMELAVLNKASHPHIVVSVICFIMSQRSVFV